MPGPEYLIEIEQFVVNVQQAGASNILTRAKSMDIWLFRLLSIPAADTNVPGHDIHPISLPGMFSPVAAQSVPPDLEVSYCFE